MKHTIIGAGPIGTYLAWQLAKNKQAVELIEEHKTIGAPVQCTGILTDDISKYIPKRLLNEVTKNKVTSTVIHSPNKKVEIPIKTNYVIDNIQYCQRLADMAIRSGANISTEQRYTRNDNDCISIKDLKTQKTKTVRSGFLIGADGPTSSVAKENNLYTKRSFLTGIQAVVKIDKDQYDENIHFWPHIGEYAWYCPEGEGIARIGVASASRTKKIFDEFIKKFKGRTLQIQGGPIPTYKPRPKVQRRYGDMTVQLVGDSVPFIKNTTGGGIVPGTKAAHILAQNPKNYEKNLGSLKRELYTHYLLNKALRNFTPKEWDKLIGQANDEGIKKILRENSRDEAFKIVTKLILKKPSMMIWIKKVIG